MEVVELSKYVNISLSSELVKRIEKAIKKGWKPRGGYKATITKAVCEALEDWLAKMGV